MGIARQIQTFGIGGGGSILRLPIRDFAGAIEATPAAPDVHPTISADMRPTNRPLVDLASAPLTITPQIPSQLAAVKKQIEANDPSKSKTIWYIVGALVLVLVLVMVAKR